MSPMTIGLNSRYSDRLKDYDITFASEIKDLPNFLNNSKTIENQIWQFISPKRTLPTALRIHQTIRQTKGYEEDSSYIFVDLENLKSEEIRERVLEDFGSSSSHNLLVIDCLSSGVEEYTHELWQRLFNVTKSNLRKRLILIVEGDENSTIKFDSGCETFHVRDSDISIENLEPGSQRKLLEKMVVRFQGDEETTSFQRLLGIQDSNGTGAEISKDLGRIIDSNTFVDLIEGKEIRIGHGIQKLGECEEYYIPRTFIRHEVIKVQKSDETANATSSKRTEKLELAEAHDKSSTKNICWRLFGEFKGWCWNRLLARLMETYGEKNKSESNTARSDSEKCLTQDELIDNTEHRGIVIISDKAGTGKSTVLTSIGEKIKENNPTSLVIRIDLAHHSEALDMADKNRSFGHRKTGAAVKFLLRKLLRIGSDLELRIFKRIIKYHSGAAILFDGFDEISPDHEDTVITLLQALSKLKHLALFVTTRSHASQVLKAKLRVRVFYTLQPFAPENQRDFFRKFWSRKCGLNDMKTFLEKAMKTYAEAVIEPPANSDSIGIPLQTRLMAESVERKLSDFVDGSDDRISGFDDDKLSPPRDIGILGLFESFVNTKFHAYWDKIKSDECPNSANEEDHKMGREIFWKAHQKFALEVLFGGDIVALLLPKSGLGNNFKSHQEIFDDPKPAGLVTEIINGQPQFIHRSLAEYFAATFFIDTLKDDDQNHRVQEFCVLQLFGAMKYQVICAFLNCLLAREVVKNMSWRFNLIRHTHVTYGIAWRVANEERHVEIWKFLQYHRNTDRAVVQRKIVAYLIEKAADIAFLSMNHDKPLHFAVSLSELDIVKRLVEENAGIESKTLNGEAPLHLAAKIGDLAIVEYLVSERANIESRTNDGSTPLHSAIENGHLNVVELLITGRASPKGTLTSDYLAFGRGYRHIAKYFIRQQADIESQTDGGLTPLHLAVSKGYLNIVVFLLSKGAKLESPIAGKRPLHFAVEYGNLPMVKYLVERGANFKAQTVGGKTPLGMASESGHLADVGRYLILKDAEDVKSQTKLGVIRYRSAVVQIDLREKSSLPDLREVLLHQFVEAGNLEAVKLAIKSGTCIGSQNEDGLTPLHRAAEFGQLEILQYLIDQGADI